MDRESALKSYQEAVSGKISEFHSRMGEYFFKHAEQLETLVCTAIEMMSEQMEKQGKEYVCFMHFALLKTDMINRKYRIYLHGLDMRWYLDEEPVEVYVDAEELFTYFDRLWEDLIKENQGYGGAVNRYDIQNLLFDELAVLESGICQILRYRLRDWEKKGIFRHVTRSPYWVLKWGEYRDRSEMLIQTDRVEKESDVWENELAKAKHKPEALVFGYWYKGTYRGRTLQDLDMRFITFETCNLQNMEFRNCNLEGSRFSGSRLENCRFEGCNLWGADFRGCSFEQTSFEGAELAAAIFPAESVPFLGISAEQLQVIRLDREERA